MMHTFVSSRHVRALACAAIAATVVATVPASTAQAVVDGNFTAIRSWGTNGRVNSIVVGADRVYIGGQFSTVVDPTGLPYAMSNLAVYIPSEQRFDVDWDGKVNGTITAMALSPNGSTLYVGGNVTSVNGQSRTRLAALNTNSGSVKGNFAPTTLGTIDELATDSSGRVYVGGLFSQITDSQSRPVDNVARLSENGVVDLSWTPNPTGEVSAIEFPADGTSVMLGGDFWKVHDLRQPNLAKVQLDGSGLSPGFIPPNWDQGKQPRIKGLDIKGNRLYIASGGNGGGCSSVDIPTSSLQWSYHTNGDLEDVEVGNGTVWCGGHFDGTASFGGQPRKKLAAVNEATGAIMPYAPAVDSALGVFSLAASGDGVYVGGDFNKVGTTKSPRFVHIVPSSDAAVPLVPVHLGARAGNGAATLFWDAPWSDNGAAISSYAVWRSANNGPWLRVGTVAATAARTFAQTSLTNGTSYAYRIAAVNSVGQGAQTGVVTVVPANVAAVAPSAPRALTASSTMGSAALAWVAPIDNGGAPLTGYVVERSLNAGAWQAVATVAPTATTYTDDTVSIGDEAAYRVVAQNPLGSEPSEATSVTIIPAVPDAAVLTATVVGGAVVLTWSAPDNNGSPIKGYNVIRDAVQVKSVNGSTTTWTDTTVLPGVSYTYQVRARNLMGNGALSNSVTVVP